MKHRTSNNKFFLTYEMHTHPEGKDADEVRKWASESTDRGATHAMVGLSCIYPDDGSFSMMLCSWDGRTGECMSDAEVFKCWTLLSERLARSETLPEGKRKFAEATWQCFCELLMENARKEQGSSS